MNIVLMKKNGYTVLGTEWIQKSYQKQLHALIKCPNLNHKPYPVWWNNFLKGYFCKECDYENRNKMIWNKELVTDFYKKNGLTVANVNDWHTVDKPTELIDDEGYKYMASITTIKQSGDKSNYKFNIYNPFSLENIMVVCYQKLKILNLFKQQIILLMVGVVILILVSQMETKYLKRN
ncbi:MAG TPA: hypothetical protein VIK86_02825 [Candidatus Paceibacterota bacterium]